MGNGYNQHFHHQNIGVQKSTFLPLLCSKPAIKDVALPKLEDRCASSSNDPLSPKIGCMGQVKRNNKINGFPTTSHNKLAITTATNNNNNVKYFKLKKLFSGKNLTANTATTACTRREVSNRKSKYYEGKERADVCISIFEMDPPLPVTKKVAKPDDKGEENSLWKRRSGGGALKTLELQHIQIPRHRLEINTV
ncbi:hypothetical protein JRO89_XS07G0161000 [Xanthoceras sorbifolium]|uniref:Uncharacterized protein n=1 Tax=Xanthoceras sorbifolium TaxID=99658 RepID=A0ABQ8HU30_9ROSI|nr:hypothetical protein JRO89_XS07G0161000 [Xanthoceras sorbifolium]